MNDFPLGRRTPTDWDHVSKHPLRTMAGVERVAVAERVLVDAASWWRFYDQGAEGSCFPAGTLIEMADGSHKPIEDVSLLDRVRTAESRESTVLANMVRLHVDGLVRLGLRGHGHLRATPEHPILTRRGYVAIGELRIGDEVRLPAVLRESATHLDTARWISEPERRVTTTGTRYVGVRGRGEVTITKTAVPESIPLDATFGRIIGLWLAEGSTTPNKVAWHFGGHERETLVPDLMEQLRRIGCEPRLQVRGNGTLIVVVYGKGWRLLFERMLSHGPYDKSLPADLADGPRDFLRAVLDGWLDGDGHRRRGGREGVTVSHRLALAMYRIGQGLGLGPSIRVGPPSQNRHAATRRDRWDVGFRPAAQASIEDDAVWRKVNSLTHEDWAGHVYNLEVEGDHSYVAEGVGVHNCVGFGCSRMMSLLNRKQYKARWLYQEAQRVDEWEDTPPEEGTSVRAACDILRTVGHRPAKLAAGKQTPAVEGIAANRWATSVDEVRWAVANGLPVAIGVNWYAGFDVPGHVQEAPGPSTDFWVGHPKQGKLGSIRGGHCVCVSGVSDKRQAVAFLNSWGMGYPRRTWMPYSIFQRLLDEDGEGALVVDR